MPRDFRVYADPGVFVEEVPSPVVSSPLVSPTIIALVGDSQLFREASEVIQIYATPATQLTQSGVAPDSISIRSRATGTTYVGPTSFSGAGPWVGTDYTVTAVDATIGTYSVITTGGGAITDGEFVTVAYNYTDANYFDVYRFREYESVRAAYGEPFDASGTVLSPLTLAAALAFRNGADELVTVAIDRAGPTPTDQEWQDAFNKLSDEPTVNVLVPVSGDPDIHVMAKEHCDLMEVQGLLRRAFVGRDGTPFATSNVNLAALVGDASTLDSTRVTLIGPSVFEYRRGTETIELGSQYAAAAMAGLHASQPPQVPLTRKRVLGFLSPLGQESESAMVDAQRQGVTVLFQRRDRRILIRHGVTTKQDPSIYEREISIQAARDRLRGLIQDSLEASDLIGGINTASTPDAVMGVVTSALEFSQETLLVAEYSDVQWRIPSNTPTVVEIRFQYRPSVPLNYISVVFAMNTDTGEVQFTSEEAVA